MKNYKHNISCCGIIDNTMKKLYFSLVTLITALSLVSCNRTSGGNDEPTPEPTPAPEEPIGASLEQAEMSFICSDLKSSYAPSTGDVKMLVIPITFATSMRTGVSSNSFQEWTVSKLGNINNYYFGENNSLKSYYNQASFGQCRVTGEVTDVYEDDSIKVKNILNDGTYNTLWDMIENAVNWVLDNRTDIDWSEYDLNRDGCIDNIHLITNYCSEDWNTPLWPHMFWTRRQGTLERPLANVYSISAINHVSSAITSIHEQGHIFGLQDYYDYSNNGNSEINYIGCLDMQAWNCFDWNSYSKLSMSWVKPYVMTNDIEHATVTLNAASKNGDCLLIPADSDTWNGSAFDEYFLLELFAPYGNNTKDWNYWYGGKPGIRLYHVDSRAFGSDVTDPYNSELLIVDDLEAQQIKCKEDIANYTYNTLGANDCSNWRAYEGGIEQLADKPLLSLVQKGGDFTFSQTNGRHMLQEEDLFKAGDVFTFEKYSNFCNKSNVKQDFTNKGEVFPYKIKIRSISTDSAVVDIYKIK